MRRIFRALARRIAPTAYRKLEMLDTSALTTASSEAALVERVDRLERQLHEMRQDNRRVAELYDAVIERTRAENPLS